MSAKAVVFDIGNVLIRWAPEVFYDRVIGSERRKRLLDEVPLHDINDDIDRGEDFRETIYSAADRFPTWRSEICMWHDNWLEMASPAIDDSVVLLRALRARGVPVFALSNFGVGTFEIAERAYPFLKEFDKRFISGHLKVSKPDPKIYRLLEEGVDFAPSELLFADDRADNIAAAQARGWQTHLFTEPQAWAACLSQHGLLPLSHTK